MGKYPIFVVNQLSHGPILVLEDVNISFFLSFSLYVCMYVCMYVCIMYVCTSRCANHLVSPCAYLSLVFYFFVFEFIGQSSNLAISYLSKFIKRDNFTSSLTIYLSSPTIYL